MMSLIYSPQYENHQAALHPESPERLKAIMATLNEQNVLDEIELINPLPASREDLLRVHTSPYLDKLETFCLQGGGWMDMDTYAQPQSYDVAKLAAGGAITAAESVLDGNHCSYALLRPPGHHALPDRAMGFCLINNLAVALEYLREKKGMKKFLIIDFDVHYGNGTAHTFYNDPNVLYISLHQDPQTIFPGEGYVHEIGEGKGEGYNINLPLAPGAQDADYIYLFKHVVEPLVEEFKAEFHFFDAGFDAHRDDPLSRIELSDDFYQWIAKEMLKLEKPPVILLEGGYDLDALARSNLKMINTLKDHDTKEQASSKKGQPKVNTLILVDEVKELLSSYFNL